MDTCTNFFSCWSLIKLLYMYCGCDQMSVVFEKPISSELGVGPIIDFNFETRLHLILCSP